MTVENLYCGFVSSSGFAFDTTNKGERFIDVEELYSSQ